MGVTAAARDEKAAPTAVDARARLAAIARAASLLREELNNQHILGRLDCAEAEPMQSFGLVPMLATLEVRARLAAAAVPEQKGRGKPAVIPDGLGAKDLCALVVLLAWGVAQGNSPGVGNEDASLACEEYWQACGQSSLGKAGSGWRRYLTAARSIVSAPQPGRQAMAMALLTNLFSDLG